MGRPGSSFLPRILTSRRSSKRLEHRAAVDPADVLDLGAGHRLPVGDDGQRLQGGPGEPLRLHPQEAAGEAGVERRGAQLPAARPPRAARSRRAPRGTGPESWSSALAIRSRSRPVAWRSSSAVSGFSARKRRRLQHRPHPPLAQPPGLGGQLLEGLVLLLGNVDLGRLDLLQRRVARLGLLGRLERRQLLGGDGRRGRRRWRVSAAGSASAEASIPAAASGSGTGSISGTVQPSGIIPASGSVTGSGSVTTGSSGSRVSLIGSPPAVPGARRRPACRAPRR